MCKTWGFGYSRLAIYLATPSINMYKQGGLSEPPYTPSPRGGSWILIQGGWILKKGWHSVRDKRLKWHASKWGQIKSKLRKRSGSNSTSGETQTSLLLAHWMAERRQNCKILHMLLGWKLRIEWRISNQESMLTLMRMKSNAQVLNILASSLNC